MTDSSLGAAFGNLRYEKQATLPLDQHGQGIAEPRMGVNAQISRAKWPTYSYARPERWVNNTLGTGPAAELVLSWLVGWRNWCSKNAYCTPGLEP